MEDFDWYSDGNSYRFYPEINRIGPPSRANILKQKRNRARLVPGMRSM